MVSKMEVVMKKALDLGELQSQFEMTRKAAVAAEKVLKRAQDARDAAKSAFAQAEVALKDGTRAVLG